MSYISFIDLLGVSNIAQSNSKLFSSFLSSFRQQVTDAALVCRDKVKVFIFSDCAYLSSDNIEDIIKFLQHLRHKLLIEGIYIKGAISRGQLEEVSASDAKANPELKSLKNMHGFNFGADVVNLYQIQYNLKGVGISLNIRDFNDETKKFFITSCHIPVANSRTPACFYDLKYYENDVSDLIFDNCLRNFFKSHATAKKYGRYYIPLLISIVQSLPTLNCEDDNYCDYIIKKTLSTQFERIFSDVVGIEYLYFSLLNVIMTSEPFGKYRDKIITFVVKRKYLTKRIEAIPIEIFSSKNRTSFLDELARRMM